MKTVRVMVEVPMWAYGYMIASHGASTVEEAGSILAEACRTHETARLAALASVSIHDAGLSVRARNALSSRMGFKTLYEVSQLRREDLLVMRNVGPVTVQEIEWKLEDYGWKLRS